MAKYRVTTPDGHIYEIEGPDGASDNEVIAAAQTHLKQVEPDKDFAKPVKGPDIVEQRSVPEQLADSTKNTLAGIAEGAASLIDMPANFLGKIMAAGSSGIGLPDWVTNALNNPITVGSIAEKVAPKPSDPTGSMVRAFSQGMGGALGGVGVGNLLSKSAQPVTRAVGTTLAEQPGTQVVAGVAGAGAAESARLGGAPVPLQIATGIAAGGAAPSTLRATAGGVEAAANRLITDEGVRQAAARMIQKNATNPLGRLLDLIDASPVTQRSGASPTLAEATLDPGIAGLQRALGNSTVTGGAQISSALTRNAQARGAALDSALGSGDPRALTAAAEGRARQLEREAANARQAVGPDVAPDAAGETIRSRLDENYRTAKARTGEAYDNPVLQDDPPVRLRPFDREEVELPTIPQPTDITDFREGAVKGARSALPQRPQSLMQFVRKQGGVHPESAGVGDLAHAGINARTQPGLVNQNGRDLDMLREAAEEAGFLPHGSTVDDLVQGMAGEFNGAKPVHADPSAQVAYDEAREARDWWRKQFDTRGLDPVKMSDGQWRQFYNDLQDAATEQTTNVDPNAVAPPQPGKLMGPFQQTITALRNRYFGDGGAEAPSYVRAFFDDVLNADETGLKTMEGWERRALDMASKAPDKPTAAFLQSVSRAIGARASMEGGPERRAALDAARSVRREQGETFESGNVGKALEREDYGRYRVPDGSVGQTLVPPGRTGGEAVDQLARAAGPDDAESLVRSEVRRALDQAGTDPNAVSRVAMKYREAISRIPAVAADIRHARASSVLQRAFERSPLGSLRGEAGRDPNAAVARLITADDAGRSLRRFAGEIANSPVAVAGLRRGVANWITASTKTTGVTEDLQAVPSTPKMIGAIERVLKTTRDSSVLTNDQRALLNSVRRELRQDQFARSSNRAAGSDTMRNVDTQLGMLRLATLIPGGEKAKTVLEVILKVAGRTDMLRDTLAEAMTDPKFAAELLREQHPQRLEKALRRIKSLNIGATTGSAAATEEGP